MSITLSTQPQGQVYTFNESRLQKIVQAKTLDEAQRMGFFDRMMDRFVHGGAKREAIKQLYDSITSPAPHESQPAGLLTRFHRLRDLADDTQRTAFTVAFTPPDGQGHWACSLQVGDTAIHASPAGMLDEPATSFAAFHATLKADALLQQSGQLAQAVLGADPQPTTAEEMAELMRAKALDFAHGVNATTGGHATVDELLNELLQLQLTQPDLAGQIRSTLDAAQLAGTSVLKELSKQHEPAAVSRLLEHLKAPVPDDLEVIKEAVKLGRCIQAQVGIDENMNHLEKRLKAQCAQQFGAMDTRDLLAMYRKFIDQPILCRSNAAITDARMEVIRQAESQGEFYPGDPEFEDFLLHSQPIDYAGHATNMMFDNLEHELRQRGQEEHLLQETDSERIFGSVMPSDRFQYFLECHMNDRNPIEQAASRAHAQVPPQMPPPGSLLV